MADLRTLPKRLLDIRRRLRDERKPLSYEDLVARIAEATGYSMSLETVRRFELGDRIPNLDQIRAIAAVDPLQRGAKWLAYGDDTEDKVEPLVRGDDDDEPPAALRKTPRQTG